MSLSSGSLMYSVMKDSTIYYHLGGVTAMASAGDTIVLLHPYCPHASSCMGTTLEGYSITSSSITSLYYTALNSNYYSTNGVKIGAIAS